MVNGAVAIAGETDGHHGTAYKRICRHGRPPAALRPLRRPVGPEQRSFGAACLLAEPTQAFGIPSLKNDVVSPQTGFGPAAQVLQYGHLGSHGVDQAGRRENPRGRLIVLQSFGQRGQRVAVRPHCLEGLIQAVQRRASQEADAETGQQFAA